MCVKLDTSTHVEETEESTEVFLSSEDMRRIPDRLLVSLMCAKCRHEALEILKGLDKPDESV